MYPYTRTKTRLFSSLLRRKSFPITPYQGPLIPEREIVDEEACPGYDPKSFYAAKVGDVLANRYQILVKVGWGVSSTVWFARDMRGFRWQAESAVALKISNATTQARIYHEREIEQHIATADPSHPGRELLRTFSDYFEITGPQGGKHSCMAYEPMREPFWIYRKRFRDERVPLLLLKTYIQILLEGLDYLHTECKVVHTDLKLDNIMVTFEDSAMLGDIMNSHLEQSSMEYKIDSTGRHVYRCHNDFGPLRGLRSIPKIVDFGLATRLNGQNDCGVYPIQPDPYCAPEVLLGCGWKMSADIWNFGLWDIIQGEELFREVHDKEGRYDAKAHLAEMIALLGPPPPNLIARYHSVLDSNWPKPIQREDGKLCASAREYFGGPFFDEDGKYLYQDLIPDRKLTDTNRSSLLEGNDRESFLSFVKMMLTWLPEDRKTARELVGHQFLQLQ
ncbi:CMGC/SRPK protein kinase [Emergomyces pasteurianus Ep9510]|uniref:non-specific serine/threonine protein kinase n=1 Tax=Emergomyces pasteurianus Ep9510 TaxID=1447872 RepID=A0A1J9QU88_9EURO|nr:CMGC/SRPK protein kinase [Emergomyces pasteurianus Ep9510]